jgi:hypothetical protein
MMIDKKLATTPALEGFETARNGNKSAPGGHCYDWWSDGCTMSPDKPLGNDFTGSCTRR